MTRRPVSRSLLLMGAARESRTASTGLAGHEQAIASRVVSDAVEDVLGGGSDRPADAGQIEPRGHPSRVRRDDGDAIGGPDVGVHLALHQLELIEFVDRLVAVLDDDASGLAQRLGIEKAEGRRAVAHDQATCVVRQSPPFAGVSEGPLQREGREVVHEADLGGVGQLDEPIFPVGQPLREVPRVHIVALKHLAGLELDLPDARRAVVSRALEQDAVPKNQPLRESAGIVRKRVHDRIAVDRRSCRLRGLRFGAQPSVADTTAATNPSTSRRPDSIIGL